MGGDGLHSYRFTNVIQYAQKHCESDIKMVDGVVCTTSQSEARPSLELTEETETQEDMSTKDTAQVSVSVEVRSTGEGKESSKKDEEPALSATPPDDEAVKSKIPPPSKEDIETSEVPLLSDEQLELDQQPARKQTFHISALSILSPQPPKEERDSSTMKTPTTTTAPVVATATPPGTTAATSGTGAAAAKQASSASPSLGKQTTSSSSKPTTVPSPLPTPPLTISPALISAVSVTDRGQCTPTLLVYSVRSNRSLEKGKSELKVKPPMPPPPDPLDYDPWEPIELAPSYMGTVPSTSSTSSVLDVLSEAKADANSSPADLKYLHSIPLNEFSCGANSGTMPEIKEVLPLAGGQLVAVLCNVSSLNPLLTSSSSEEDGQTEKGKPPHHGGILLFRTTVEEDGDRLRLRVHEKPVKVISFADYDSTVVGMCVMSSESKTAERLEDRQPNSKDEEKETDILLGTVSRNGDVVVYDCGSLEMNAIGHYSCLKSHDFDEQSRDPRTKSHDASKPVECVGCTYCPPTYHLAVADSSGQVTLLSVRELLLARAKLNEDEIVASEDQGRAIMSQSHCHALC